MNYSVFVYNRLGSARPSGFNSPYERIYGQKPDVNDLASKMVLIAENWKIVKEQALLNAEIMHKNFSWRSSSETLINIILKKLT